VLARIELELLDTEDEVTLELVGTGDDWLRVFPELELVGVEDIRLLGLELELIDVEDAMLLELLELDTTGALAN